MKSGRLLSWRVIALQVIILVSHRRLYWYSPVWLSCLLLALGAVLTAYTARKDYKEGFFDGFTICCIIISALACGVTLYGVIAAQ